MQPTDEQLEEYLEELDIELLPHQKEIFKRLTNADLPRIVIPAKLGRSQVLALIKVYEIMQEVDMLGDYMEE